MSTPGKGRRRSRATRQGNRQSHRKEDTVGVGTMLEDVAGTEKEEATAAVMAAAAAVALIATVELLAEVRTVQAVLAVLAVPAVPAARAARDRQLTTHQAHPRLPLTAVVTVTMTTISATRFPMTTTTLVGIMRPMHLQIRCHGTRPNSNRRGWRCRARHCRPTMRLRQL